MSPHGELRPELGHPFVREAAADQHSQRALLQSSYSRVAPQRGSPPPLARVHRALGGSAHTREEPAPLASPREAGAPVDFMRCCTFSTQADRGSLYAALLQSGSRGGPACIAGATLALPQLPALRPGLLGGGLSRLLAVLGCRHEPLSRPGPSGWLWCGREAWPKSPIPIDYAGSNTLRRVCSSTSTASSTERTQRTCRSSSPLLLQSRTLSC